MYSIISFSIAACKSLRAPSCSSCSKNGFSASSARFSSEITLFSLTGVSFLFGTSGEAAGGLFFLLKGCAFSHLFIHNFRLYLLLSAGNDVAFALHAELQELGAIPQLRLGILRQLSNELTQSR